MKICLLFYMLLFATLWLSRWYFRTSLELWTGTEILETGKGMQQDILLFSINNPNKKNLRVRSFVRIRIRISDQRRSFWANPFLDQWSIKSTLDKDSSVHWSARSKYGSLDHWSNAFLWAKDPASIIFKQVGTSYIDRKDYWQSLHKFCDKHELKSIL